jgi:hypothetical protein
VKCAGYHLTKQCHQKERLSDVWCVLCGGNHPANYKGCMVYKDLQKKTYPPLHLKQYLNSCTNQTNLTHSDRCNICSNNQTKFLRCHKCKARSTHKPTSSANQWYKRLKKYDEKPFWANRNYAKSPHNHAY